ncbi:hypothetical protein PO909_000675, partial [Leuciscus waleckii]
ISFSIKDIRQILEGSTHGSSILSNLEQNHNLCLEDRRKMVRILVSHLMEKFGEYPSPDRKKELALTLVTQFPCLRDSEGSGYEVWYTPGRYRHPATGFLEERLRNIRKRLHSHSSTSRERSQTTDERRATVTDRITLLPDSQISEADSNKMTEWLKKNKQPVSQVEEYMRGTAVYRAQWIRENGSKSLIEITQEYPRLLDTPGMTLGDVALKTLPAILPPLPYKTGCKMVRPSYQEAKQAFVDLQPVGTNIIQYLEEEEQRRQFPHVLQLGDKLNCSQAFVIVGGVALEQDSLLQAVDTCFKLFYVLDIEYPKPSAAVWQFLQHTIYSVPGGVPSTHCRLLRQFIIG